MDRPLVLIVEDEEINRCVLKNILADYCNVDEAENGKVAWEKISKYSGVYSAVLLDIIMPEMDGYGVLEKIRESGIENLPVIVLTVSSDEESERKALEAGAWDFVAKPFRESVLLSRLKNAVARSRVSAYDKMKYVTEHDRLTGLYRRAMMFSETRNMLDANKDMVFAFVRIDIDRFALYNTAFGEAEGDKLLKFLAMTISQVASEQEKYICGRMNADVFCACVSYSGREKLAKDIEYIQGRLSKYRSDYRLEISVGVCEIDDITLNIDDYYLRASLAATKCKNQIDTHIAFYDNSVGKKLAAENAIINEMQSALDSAQFEVYLQPKFRLSPESVCGAEALVRWNHPVRGLVSPDEFIPVFERNGFISKLDYYVWDKTCAMLRSWLDRGISPYPVSVNMSRISLYNPKLTELMKELTKKYNISPSLLQLEVTESAYMTDPELMENTIESLHGAGFTILMDDFGSGYSSLNTLKQIKVDILKIDMKFLPVSDEIERGEIILSSIIKMANWLGMSVIVEGVETRQQRDFLEGVGCDSVQGFYYSKAIKQSEYEEKYLFGRKNKSESGEKYVPQHNFTVLIISGSETDRSILGDCLRELYHVRICGNADEGFAFLRRGIGKIRLVIVDSKLDGISGIEFIRCCRRDNAINAIPKMLITSDSSVKNQVEAFSEGVFNYISKPFTREDVLEKVEEIMKLSQRTTDFDSVEQLYSGQAGLDADTKLLNKLSFNELGTALINSLSNDKAALMVLDIDNFKQINDRYGRIAGDAAIRCVADELAGIFRRTDLIGRFGGDEFVVLMKNLPNMDIVTIKAEEIIRSVSESSTRKLHISISVSIGIAHSEQNDTIDTLFARADQALFEAKTAGKTRYSVYGEAPKALDSTANFSDVQAYNSLEDAMAKETSIMMRQLVDAIPGGVVIYKFSKKIETIYYSAGVPKLSGHTREEYDAIVSGSPIDSLVFKDDRADMLKSVMYAINHAESLSITFRIVHKNGNLVWIQLTASKIREEDGCLIYYAVFSQPTDEAEMYRNLVEDSDTGVLIAETDNRRILYTNRAWRKTALVPENEAISGRLLSEVMGENRRLFSSEEIAALSQEHYTEFHKIGASGRYLYVSAKMINWNDKKAYLCFVIDETETQTGHIKLRKLLDNVPGGIGIFELKNRVPSPVYVNDGFFRLVGTTRDKYLEGNVGDGIYPEDIPVINSAIERIYDGEDNVDITYRFVGENGTKHWLRLVGYVTERFEDKITLYCSYSDVDLIMETQHELANSRAMLNAALNSVRVLTWIYNPTKRCVINSGALSVKNMILPEVVENVPQSLVESGIISEESRDELFEQFRLLDEGVFVQKELCTQPEGESKVWRRIAYTPVYDDNGRMIYAIGTAIDITEQKDKERYYVEQLRLKKVLSNGVVAIALFNLTQNSVTDIESDNEEIVKQLNSGTLDEVIGAITPQNVCFPDRQSLLETFYHGEYSVCIRHYSKAAQAWVESEFTLIENPYTHDIEAFAVLRNVNEQVRSEKIVTKLMQYDYESIFTIDALTGSGMPFSDNGGNDAADFRNSEERTSDGVGNYLRRFCIDDDLDRVLRETSIDYIKQKLETGASFSTIFSLMKGGRIIHKRAAYSYLDDDKATILCAVQDMTETYIQEERQRLKLEEALRNAREANNAKTDFLSNMSHDMRTPMNGILGLSALIKEKTDINEIHSDIDQILLSGRYLLNLINDTLDMSKIEAGRLELNLKPINSENVFKNVFATASLMAQEKEISLEIATPGIAHGKWVKVLADSSRIEQVLINVISNAIKYTNKGGHVSVCMETVSVSADFVCDKYVVSDNGIGMSEEYLTHIFEPFSQEGRLNGSDDEGAGLGMSIVKKLVTLMNGEISVQSKLDEGTTVTLLMKYPRYYENESEKNAQTGIDFSVLSGKRVLICEDHPLNSLIASNLLEKHGAVCETAVNGRVGVEKFRGSECGYYDAVLMDIRMPEMNGLDAARAIRQSGRADSETVPIIAMTAYAFESDVKACLDAGMNEHISKPIDPTVFYEKLVKHLSVGK